MISYIYALITKMNEHIMALLVTTILLNRTYFSGVPTNCSVNMYLLENVLNKRITSTHVVLTIPFSQRSVTLGAFK